MLTICKLGDLHTVYVKIGETVASLSYFLRVKAVLLELYICIYLYEERLIHDILCEIAIGYL